MLVMVAEASNATVQPLRPPLPAVTVMAPVKPDPQLLSTA